MGKDMWPIIERDYVHALGTITLKELSEKYDVPYVTMKDRAIKAGWASKRTANTDRVRRMVAREVRTV